MENSLFDQIVNFENLLFAASKAVKGKKDRVDVLNFTFGMEREIFEIEELLRAGSYTADPYRIFKIFEPKERVIAAATLRDRIVHHAIINIVELRLERRLISDTYACRKDKGGHKAIKKAQQFSRKYEYYLKCDIRKYFENIDHTILLAMINKLFVGEIQLLVLLEKIVSHQPPNTPKGKGLPIGNLTSQHFANLYLDKLDHYLKDQMGIKGYVRYMDDFLVFNNDKKELAIVLKKIELFLHEKLALELKSKVTQIAPVMIGIPFLGMRIFPRLIRIKRENFIRLKRKIKKREEEYIEGKITEELMCQSVGSMIAHSQVAQTINLRRRITLK